MIVTVVSDVLGVENNGVTIAAMNLIRSLKEKGHTVCVLCPDVDRMGQEGYYIVPTLNAGPLNGYVERVGVVIARADQRIVRQAIKGADIVHIMLPFPLGRCALRIAKEEGIPVCAGFHAMAENVSVHLKMQNVPFANHLVYEYFAGFYRDCDAIHYPTQYLRDLYEGMYGKTNGYVISNGVSDAIHPVQTQRPARYEGEYLIYRSLLAGEVAPYPHRCRGAVRVPGPRPPYFCGEGTRKGKARFLRAKTASAAGVFLLLAPGNAETAQ